jgi:hypothetical protein
MRRSDRRGDHRRMDTPDGETRLALRIDLEADPRTGSLTSARAAQRRFSGWIGLAAALEAMRAELSREPRCQQAGEPGAGL